MASEQLNLTNTGLGLVGPLRRSHLAFKEPEVFSFDSTNISSTFQVAIFVSEFLKIREITKQSRIKMKIRLKIKVKVKVKVNVVN